MGKEMKLPVNQIICGDCLEVMKDWPDGCVDLVLCSPPYNMGKGPSLGYQPNSTVGQAYYGDYVDDMPDEEYSDWIIKSIHRCLEISRYVFWNMQYLTGTKDVIARLIGSFSNRTKDIFIWQKQAVAQICALQAPILAPGYEFVFMLGPDSTKIFRYSAFPPNGYVPNIQTWYKTESFREHHATYPLAMCEYFTKYFTHETDLILDPFCGSGTTCVAAKKLGRNYIGIDISPEYCAIARERLKAVETGVPVKEARNGQLPLF